MALFRSSLMRTFVMARRMALVSPSPALTKVTQRSYYKKVTEGYYQHPEENLNSLPSPHSIVPGQYQLDSEKLKMGLWPWDSGVRARLPDHFKTRYIERFSTEPIPVHYKANPAKYVVNKHGTRQPVQNLPIPLHFPEAANQGLWGGEGVVIGLRKRKDDPMKPRTPRIWKPRLHRRVFHSEILDKYMAITVTMRTLDLVDEAHGFDNYILKTHEVDLHSKLGMRLRAEMIRTLIHKSMYPEDPAKRDFIYNKYKQHIIPEEELEWLGLTVEEAEQKQKEKEMDVILTRPLKEIYAEQLIQELKEKSREEKSEESSAASKILAKLNPFKEESKGKDS